MKEENSGTTDDVDANALDDNNVAPEDEGDDLDIDLDNNTSTDPAMQWLMDQLREMYRAPRLPDEVWERMQRITNGEPDTQDPD